MRSMWILAAGTVVLAACGSNGGDVTGPPNTTPPPPTGSTPPVANFGATCTGLTCTFTDSSTAPTAGGSIKTWAWKFGDDSTSSEQNPSHTYAAANTYNATLTVTDSAGVSDSVTKPVTVTAPTVTATLTCTNATAPGTPTTCTFTLPVAASVKAVSTDSIPCEAHGDSFIFTAPVTDTLTVDGCFMPVGTTVELPSSPAGTVVTFAILGGLTQFMTAVQVSGQYPQWSLGVEDAVGAPFPPDFADMGVTLTVIPTSP